MRYKKLPEFDIKLRYHQQLELGLLLGLLLFSVIFIYSKEIRLKLPVREIDIPVFDVEEILPTKQEKETQAPALPTIPAPAADVDIPPVFEYEIGQEIGYIDFEPPPPPIPAEPFEFHSVEKPPSYIGGIAALHEVVKYPEMARVAGVDGVAQIAFTVDVNGIPRDFEIKGERPKGLGFAEAAIDALRQMRFRPGYQRDRAVPVRMLQTVSFTSR